MTQTEALKICNTIIAKLQMGDWTAEMYDGGPNKYAGDCYAPDRKIFISSLYLENDAFTIDTILHEISHGIVSCLGEPDRGADHGPVFQRTFEDLKAWYRDGMKEPPPVAAEKLTFDYQRYFAELEAEVEQDLQRINAEIEAESAK